MRMQDIERLAYQLFENGEFKRALLGDKTFFVTDSLEGDHSSAGVFIFIFKWLQTKEDNSFYLTKLKQDLTEICVERKKMDGSFLCLKIIRDYYIAVKYRKFDPIEKSLFMNLIKELIRSLTKEEIEMYQVKKDLDSLKDYLPELPCP